jgi:hypothetical protein
MPARILTNFPLAFCDGFGYVPRMFKTAVILFSILWASLLLVSWSGGDQTVVAPKAEVVDR